MRRLMILLTAFLPLSVIADSALPFMKGLAGDNQLPRPWGISVDYYTMDQDYDIDNLQFALPGVSLGDPSLIDVTNDVEHWDLKADAWLLPFLNVFGIIGRVESDTIVDLSKVEIVGLPFSLGKLPFSFDGDVYGLGFTLVYGTDKWFAAATTTYTDTDVTGDLNSSVTSLSVQPRVGIIVKSLQFWVGGMYLDVDEKHSGTVELPFIGDVPFAVDLVTTDHWNYTVGITDNFTDRLNMSFELGFGPRNHTLLSLNYRF